MNSFEQKDSKGRYYYKLSPEKVSNFLKEKKQEPDWVRSWLAKLLFCWIRENTRCKRNVSYTNTLLTSFHYTFFQYTKQTNQEEIKTATLDSINTTTLPAKTILCIGGIEFDYTSSTNGKVISNSLYIVNLKFFGFASYRHSPQQQAGVQLVGLPSTILIPLSKLTYDFEQVDTWLQELTAAPPPLLEPVNEPQVIEIDSSSEEEEEEEEEQQQQQDPPDVIYLYQTWQLAHDPRQVYEFFANCKDFHSMVLEYVLVMIRIYEAQTAKGIVYTEAEGKKALSDEDKLCQVYKTAWNKLRSLHGKEKFFTWTVTEEKYILRFLCYVFSRTKYYMVWFSAAYKNILYHRLKLLVGDEDKQQSLRTILRQLELKESNRLESRLDSITSYCHEQLLRTLRDDEKREPDFSDEEGGFHHLTLKVIELLSLHHLS